MKTKIDVGKYLLFLLNNRRVYILPNVDQFKAGISNSNPLISCKKNFPGRSFQGHIKYDQISSFKQLYKPLHENFLLFQAADEDEPVRSGPNSKSGGREGSRGQGLSRLSIRKGRSVVHKNLEDNYGAVISANHEALAQILEQVKKFFISYYFGLEVPKLPNQT